MSHANVLTVILFACLGGHSRIITLDFSALKEKSGVNKLISLLFEAA